VGVGGRKGRLGKVLAAQPALVGQRPGDPAAPDVPVAQQELAQPMPGAGTVTDHVGAGAAQVADGLLLHGGDVDGHQLAGAVQPR